MKKLLFILCVSMAMIACEKDDDTANTGNTTPVFKNQADSLEGVYISTHKMGATTFGNFSTQIVASKTVENEFTFSNLNPYDSIINARLVSTSIVIDTVSFSSSCGGTFHYYGTGTIIDSIMNVNIKSNSFDRRTNDYSINLNQ